MAKAQSCVARYRALSIQNLGYSIRRYVELPRELCCAHFERFKLLG